MTSTILIVDDSEDDQRLYRRALKDFDHELIAASSAQAAFVRLTDLKPALSLSKRPDLILLDYNLPDMDGLAFMEKLGEHPDTRIPVVMLTGVGNETVAVEAMKHGADDYLVKDVAGLYLKLLPGTIDRVMAAHAQRVQTERLMDMHQAILDTVADGIIGIDTAGTILFANPAADRLLAPRNGLAGRPVARFIWCGEEQCDWNSHPLAAAPSDSASFYRESDFFRSEDGKIFPVAYNASAIDLNGHGDAGWVMVFQDVSERKKSDALLKQHKLVIETTNDGFWIIDPDGHLLEVNQAYADMMGYTREELLGMHISQLSLLADTQEKVRAQIERVVAQGLNRFETRHRHKDGHIIDFEESVTYMAEAKCLFAFLRDITERKKNEEALRVAAVTFEAHDGIMITDADANIIRVNKAFTDITGYRPEDVLGKNPRIMSSGRHDKAFYIEMWQQLTHTGSWSGEIWDKRRNGQIYPKWLTITAVKNERQEITQYVSIFSDITARKKVEEEIRNLAFYDVLTKLPNRRLFLDRFRAALPVSARHNDYGAVLFIDLDKFKSLNDTLGHDYGDMLLIEVASRIKSCVREMDTVARLGGDEFVVLIEGLSEDEGEASYKVGLVAEKIRDALARPYQLKQHQHNSSPSIGVSLYRGSKEPVEVLLQHADMAMYQAKESGRNAVRFFDPVMQHDVEEHAALENDLRHAVEQGQLQLHYQIQVDNDNRPVGAEALLRWAHPERGLVMPGEFIPLAERSALIIEIGEWVLETACRQLALWGANEQTRELTLAVNISAKQFIQPDFVDIVAGFLNAHQFDRARLKLELTESMVLDDLAGTMAKMHALKALGVSLSMDDFGTRYSSLSYLKKLPLDQLKLDRDFVQAITREGSDALLVQNIISLANNTRLHVIAEGVETEDQLSLLKHRDCIAYQGFLFSKAVSIGEFEAMLGRGV